MKALKQAILEKGTIINEDVLKVDSFLNHQVDPELMRLCAKDIYEHFQSYPINKIVTIETSGIPCALYCAEYFHVPLVFLKKAKPSTMQQHYYQSTIHSFTKNCDVTLCGSAHYLTKHDHVLIVDDFLANGEACIGAINILQQAQATVEGISILIEKSHQSGHQRLTDMGFEVYALASIQRMKDGMIEFANDEA